MADGGITLATWVLDGGALAVSVGALVWVSRIRRRLTSDAEEAGRQAGKQYMTDALRLPGTPIRALVAKVARGAAKDEVQDVTEAMGLPFGVKPRASPEGTTDDALGWS